MSAFARYQDDRLDLQATSLTYTTLLSLVPFLAVAVSVLKAFGVHNFVEPLLTELLRTARQRGCRTLDGDGMAVFQGAMAFKLFFGVNPDVARMQRRFHSKLATAAA